MKVFVSGMSAFGPSPCRRHPNHGRKFVCDAIGIWHNISQHYLGVVGSNGLWLGNQRGMDIGRTKSCWDSMITFFSFEGPTSMGNGCCRCKFLEFDAATFFRIQFAQRYLHLFKLYIRSGFIRFSLCLKQVAQRCIQG